MSNALYFILKYESEIRKIEKVDSHSSHSQPPGSPLSYSSHPEDWRLWTSGASFQFLYANTSTMNIHIYFLLSSSKANILHTLFCILFFFSLISVSWKTLYRLKEFLQPFLQLQNILSCGYLKIYWSRPMLTDTWVFPNLSPLHRVLQGWFPKNVSGRVNMFVVLTDIPKSLSVGAKPTCIITCEHTSFPTASSRLCFCQVAGWKWYSGRVLLWIILTINKTKHIFVF